MSESVSPWIAPYMTSIAEEYGANMAAIPRFPKKKMVQLVEVCSELSHVAPLTACQFLTYNQDDILWARISDKNCLVPVRFSKEAVQEYNKCVNCSMTYQPT